MSRPGGHRSEDDLRAAFAAKATQAPEAEDVLRAVRRATRPRPSRLRWLLPAVAAAAAVAVAVPIALSVSNSNTGSAKPNMAAGGGVDASQKAERAASPSAPAAMSADIGVCRPDQVRAAVTVRRDAGVEHATLTVTALADCNLARVPRVTWNGATVRVAEPGVTAPDASAQATSGAPGRATTNPYGRLAAGATATAIIGATDQCSARAGDAVRVDWGAGEVELHATGATRRCEASAQSAKLNIGPFSGLS